MKNRSEYYKRYYLDHRAEMLERRRKYYEKHKEEELKHKREYHQEHRQEILAYHKEYRQMNPKKQRAQNLAKKVPLGSICEKCGASKNLERHHPDYDKPLSIVTLCHTCHMRIHGILEVLKVVEGEARRL